MFSDNGRIINPADIRRYVTAGRATFTVLNPQTKRRMTFRVRCGRKTGCFFAEIRDSFGFDTVATIYPNGVSPTPGATPEAIKAFLWIWNHIDTFPPSLEFYHEGSCARCGRPLTDPESIRAGYGPDCLRRYDFTTAHPHNTVAIEDLRRASA